MSMVVFVGTSEQSGEESPQECWKLQVQVPEESEQQANQHELEQELRTAGQGVDEAEGKHHRDGKQQQAGQRRQQRHERSEP